MRLFLLGTAIFLWGMSEILLVDFKAPKKGVGWHDRLSFAVFLFAVALVAFASGLGLLPFE